VGSQDILQIDARMGETVRATLLSGSGDQNFN
jgi:hypothetical protein